jgi:hypothetical protein
MPYQDPNGQWLNDDGSPLYPYLPPNYDAYTAVRAAAGR